jgi:hypothetical protein
VLLLVKALWDEAITEIRRSPTAFGANPDEAKALLIECKTKLNLTNLIFNLPAMIKEAENQITVNQFKKDRFAAAQEGGSI